MRLTVISGAELSPAINWTTLAPPLETALAQQPGVTIVRAPATRRGSLRASCPAWLAAIRAVRGADAVFWIQMSSRPPAPMWALAYAQPSATRSALVIDAWEPKLNRIRYVAAAQRLAVCFVAFREAALRLRGLRDGSRFEWLPFGFDRSVFRDLRLERHAYAYWMGRRHEPLHQALIRHCAARGVEYRYSTRGGEYPDPHDLNRAIAQCRYFVVTPPDLDNPAKTGGFSPMMMRYLEGLGAGARLLGVLPNAAEYDAMLPRDSVVRCAPDGSDLAHVLDAADADPLADETFASAHTLVHREHGWERRAETIYERLRSRLQEDPEDSLAD